MNHSNLYSLGVYLAEYIIHTKMPCLSNNAWTNNVIQVTWDEAQEAKRLADAWYSKLNEEKYKLTKGLEGSERYAKEREAQDLVQDEWDAQLKYQYKLKKKYLPNILKCVVCYVDFSDEEANKEIMKGFISALWDCDHCEYSLKEEDIKFENVTEKLGPKDMTWTHVTMKLDMEAPNSYGGGDWGL